MIWHFRSSDRSGCRGSTGHAALTREYWLCKVSPVWSVIVECRNASGLAGRPQHPSVRCPTCKEKVRQWSRSELAGAGVRCGEVHSNKVMRQAVVFSILYKLLCVSLCV